MDTLLVCWVCRGRRSEVECSSSEDKLELHLADTGREGSGLLHVKRCVHSEAVMVCKVGWCNVFNVISVC